MNKGIMYISYGKKYALYTLRSIISIRTLDFKISKIPIIPFQIDQVYYVDALNDLSCPVFSSKFNIANNLIDKNRAILITRALSLKNNPFDKFILSNSDMIYHDDFSYLFDKCDNNTCKIVAIKSNFSFHDLLSNYDRKHLQMLILETIGVNIDEIPVDFPVIDNSLLVFNSELSKLISDYLIEIYKSIKFEKFYGSFMIEAILLTLLCYRNKIRVAYVNNDYNSRILSDRTKIHHSKETKLERVTSKLLEIEHDA